MALDEGESLSLLISFPTVAIKVVVTCVTSWPASNDSSLDITIMIPSRQSLRQGRDDLAHQAQTFRLRTNEATFKTCTFLQWLYLFDDHDLAQQYTFFV